MAICPKCSMQVLDEATTCNYCGAPLGAAAEQAAPAVAAAPGATAPPAPETAAAPQPYQPPQAAPAQPYQQPPQAAPGQPYQPPQAAPGQPYPQPGAYQQPQAAPGQPYQQPGAYQQPQAAPGQPYQQPGGYQQPGYGAPSVDDVTYQFDPGDIYANKAMGILAYLGILVLIPILAAPQSRFARFHSNQGLLLLIATAINFVLGLVPYIGLISWLLGIAIFVFVIMGIVNAAGGRAKKLPLIGTIELIKY